MEGQPWLREQDLTDVTDIEIRRFEVAPWLRKLGHALKCGNRTSLVSLGVDVLADGLFKFVHHFLFAYVSTICVCVFSVLQDGAMCQ